MFSELVCQGSCRPSEIIQTFGVSKNSVKRSVKKYRDEGIESFFRPRRPRSCNVLTPEVVARAQELLYRLAARPPRWPTSWKSNADTLLRPSIRDVSRDRRASPTPGRRSGVQGRGGGQRASRLWVRFDKSQRSLEDAAAPMGIACTRPLERVAAAWDCSTAPRPSFRLRRRRPSAASCRPAGLTQNGLFDHLRVFSLAGRLLHHARRSFGVSWVVSDPDGRAIAIPVAWGTGQLLGPVACRKWLPPLQKLTRLSQNHAPEQWAGRLSRDWLQGPGSGPARSRRRPRATLSRGSNALAPTQVARRESAKAPPASVNDALGQPLLRGRPSHDQGLVGRWKGDIVPRLLEASHSHGGTARRRPLPPSLRHGLRPRPVTARSSSEQMWREHRIACLSRQVSHRSLAGAVVPADRRDAALGRSRCR